MWRKTRGRRPVLDERATTHTLLAGKIGEWQIFGRDG